MANRIAHHKRIAIPRDDGAFNIPLGHGRFAIVDAEDVPLVIQRTWSVRRERDGVFYVWSGIRKNNILSNIGMGRFLLSPPAGLQVDHIDRNPLNNRRSNLRLATPRQNAANRSLALGKGGFIGVHPSRGAFYAEIKSKNGKSRVFYKRFACPKEAAIARDAAAIVKYGEFARLNFPETV